MPHRWHHYFESEKDDIAADSLAVSVRRHIAPIILVFTALTSASLVSLSLIASQYNTDYWHSLAEEVRLVNQSDATVTIVGYMLLGLAGIFHCVLLTITPSRHRGFSRLLAFTVITSLIFSLLTFSYVIAEVVKSFDLVIVA